MRALRAAVVLVLALALPAPVLAADYQAGLEAFERDDYATALKELRPLAEQGNAEAQVLLGRMYVLGRDVFRDYDEAETAIGHGAVLLTNLACTILSKSSIQASYPLPISSETKGRARRR